MKKIDIEGHIANSGIHPRNTIRGTSIGIREIDTHSLSIGLEAGNAWVATSIEDSVAIGYQSQHDNEGGAYITTLGVRAFGSITHNYSSYSVIGIGADTGFGVQTPDDEIYIGDRILSAANAGNLIFGNVIIGHDNLSLTTTFNAYNNVIIGHDLMQSAPMTDASDNVIMGSDTIGASIDKAYGNFIGGYGACPNLVNGEFGIIIGSFAGYGYDGNESIYLGNGAGGWGASHPGPTSGSYNLLIGTDAGQHLQTTSDFNICLGDGSGPTTGGIYDFKGWIETYNSDTPTLGFDFSESRVGFSANVSSLTNIIHVVASSATDPIADSWTTHASSRKEKDVTGKPDDKKILDSIRNTEVYNYKRKVELIDAEKQRIRGQFEKEKRKAEKDVKVELTEDDFAEIEMRYLLEISIDDEYEKDLTNAEKQRIKTRVVQKYVKEKKNQKRHNVEFSDDDLKEIEKRQADHLKIKESLPKFTTERTGIMIDDDNVPSEILTFDEAGNKQGIDLLAYIGYLHGAIKALTAEVDILKAK